MRFIHLYLYRAPDLLFAPFRSALRYEQIPIGAAASLRRFGPQHNTAIQIFNVRQNVARLQQLMIVLLDLLADEH